MPDDLLIALNPEEDSSLPYRTWARQSGFAVSDRGRIPAEIREAWYQAHSGSYRPDGS